MKAVGGWVGEAEVGFDFGDAAGEALAVEGAGDEFAEEIAGDYVGGTEIEAARRRWAAARTASVRVGRELRGWGLSFMPV